MKYLTGVLIVTKVHVYLYFTSSGQHYGMVTPLPSVSFLYLTRTIRSADG